MQAAYTAQVAFYLTGKQEDSLAAIAGLGLVPALAGRFRDLTSLRYDFPLLLLPPKAGRGPLATLSGAVDAAIAGLAGKPEADRVRHHAHLLEREVRHLLESGAAGTLRTLLIKAAGRLDTANDRDMADSLRRLGQALPIDAEVANCDATLPVRLTAHLWETARGSAMAGTQADIDRLTRKVGDILVAARMRSEEGRSPDALRASVGSVHTRVFDFNAFSRVLARGKPAAGLPEARFERLRWLLSVLRSQRFFPAATPSDIGPAYECVFGTCADARDAWLERQAKMIELTKAMAMAELEVAGEYDESRHDSVFAGFGARGLDPVDAARFPGMLVRVDAARMTAAETALALEMLDAGVPLKLVVVNDDILAPSALGFGAPGLGTANRALVAAAMGMERVFVVQSAASHLFQCHADVVAALAYAGPAVVSVYSGAGQGTLPPYLMAAAAMEARAFPAIVCDPSAGPAQADRVRLDGNPAAASDWTRHELSYQDAACQRVHEEVAFTPVDLLACDGRYAEDFAVVEPAAWSGAMVPAAEALDSLADGSKVPYVLLLDADNRLRRVVANERTLRAARRCLTLWHGLQELGGIHNSHAERLLARERAAWEEEQRQREAVAGPVLEVVREADSAPTETAEPERRADEAYIETPRCSTCEECVKINGKMFAYNKDKQAYIADIAAGTFRQLVEAAESCQVSVIHPGKPRDPNEPGLEELIARAALFQ